MSVDAAVAALSALKFRHVSDADAFVAEVAREPASVDKLVAARLALAACLAEGGAAPEALMHALSSGTAEQASITSGIRRQGAHKPVVATCAAIITAAQTALDAVGAAGAAAAGEQSAASASSRAVAAAEGASLAAGVVGETEDEGDATMDDGAGAYGSQRFCANVLRAFRVLTSCGALPSRTSR